MKTLDFRCVILVLFVLILKSLLQALLILTDKHCQIHYAMLGKMLYSGVRPGEVGSIKEDIGHNTITIANGKLKHYQKDKFRTIPIFPKYKQILELPMPERATLEQLRKEFKRFCPNNTLKDLRHTFTSRARECGIDNELVAIWTGHSLGNITASVYTHFSMEHQQKQAKKLNY